jgi:DNA-directed RNA polymerase specialized sigma subunit
MRISLNIGSDGSSDSTKANEARALLHLIIDAKKGDWEAKELLIQKFRPLMLSLAEKRTKDTAMINKYMEAAKSGLLTAAGRYDSSEGVDNFRIFALDYIEANMDRVEKGGGFFSRLFGLGSR